MIITKVTKDDINDLEKLASECLPIYYKSDDIIYLLNNVKYRLYKAVYNDTIIGLCFLELFQDRIHIMSICINPNYQKLGVGSNIIDFFKKKYKKPISLYVQSYNVSAVNFYVKNNFKIVKTIPDYYVVLENKEAYYMVL